MARTSTTTVFKIEKNVKIPARTFRRNGVYVTTLAKMAKGDSFKIADKKKTQSVYAAAKRLGVKITYRTEDGGAVRFWRV